MLESLHRDYVVSGSSVEDGSERDGWQIQELLRKDSYFEKMED